MNKNARAWVKALQSGEYKQGIGSLCADNLYCCLGVACELYQKATNKLVIEEKSAGFGAVMRCYNRMASILPPEVIEWLGLRDERGSFGRNRILTDENDRGKSFLSIARIIIRNQKTLFVESS